MNTLEHETDETADDAADDETRDEETAGENGPEGETPQPDAPPIEPINYDVEPAPVTGIIRGLAETIPAKATLLLAIAKLESGELLVTIQPPKSEKEGDPALPLQVKGTPLEIDAQLVDALAHYVPARNIALKTAEQIARETAAHAKKTAEEQKKKWSPSASSAAKKTPSLMVKIEPKDATLRVVDGADNAQTVKAGAKTTLSKGRYVITVSKLGFATETKPVVIGDGPQEVTIALEQLDQTSLFGGSAK
jgi:PRTRC genetic system protein E